MALQMLKKCYSVSARVCSELGILSRLCTNDALCLNINSGEEDPAKSHAAVFFPLSFLCLVVAVVLSACFSLLDPTEPPWLTQTSVPLTPRLVFGARVSHGVVVLVLCGLMHPVLLLRAPTCSQEGMAQSWGQKVRL